MNQRQALAAASRAVGNIQRNRDGRFIFIVSGHVHENKDYSAALQDRARSVAYAAACIMGIDRNIVGDAVYGGHQPQSQWGEQADARTLLRSIVASVRGARHSA